MDWYPGMMEDHMLGGEDVPSVGWGGDRREREPWCWPRGIVPVTEWSQVAALYRDQGGEG